MTKRNMSDGDGIEISPLLSKSKFGAKAAQKVDLASPFQSTVNADKFDMKRFSERREEEQSSAKIIVYIVLIVVIGVALALFVRNQISSNNDDTNTDNTVQTETEIEPVVEEPAYKISTSKKDDSLAVSMGSDVLFGSEVSKTIGSETALGVMEIDSVQFDRYATFAQVLIPLDSITEILQVGKITLSFADSVNELKLNVPSSTVVDSKLAVLQSVGSDGLSSISFNQSTNSFTFKSLNKITYRANLIKVGGIVNIVLDIKRVEVAQSTPTPATPVATTPTPSTDTTTVKPSGINLTNDFSQSKQFVTSDVKTNTVEYTEVYYTDAVSFFELAFGGPGYVGNNYVANTTAELKIENGIPYIYLTIENLKSFPFTALTASGVGIDLSTSNYVRADKISFENGTAVVKVQLKKASDFRLISEPTVDGSTQVISIQIKD